MSRIMIAGAGHAGLGLATALTNADADIRVDLYTRHTTEELLDGSRLTQMTFPAVYGMEKDAKLDFWSGLSPVFRTIGFTVSPGDGTRQTFTGNQNGIGTAIDHGAKTAQWLQQVEREETTNPRGAHIHVQTLRAETLEWFARSGMYDLVIVATGDNDTHLAPKFPRTYLSPTTRIVFQTHFEGSPPGPDVQVTTTPHGEIFCYPVLATKTRGQGLAPDLVPATAVQVYARADSPMDPIPAITPANGEPISHNRRLDAAWPHAHATLSAHTPDLAAWTLQAPCLEQSRLLRSITPRVRRPVIHIGSTPILGIGDAVLTVDPTSGQGANASTRVAATVATHILDRLDQGRPLADAAFLEAAYQDYWTQHGQHTSVFSELVTDFWSGTLPEHITQRFAGNFTFQDQADRMVVGWDDPATLGWLLNP
ncbi:hypothetical protein [Nocardiopsis nanhaiensis]